MHYIVPDTNFFLQCRDYHELDWSVVTEDVEITIAVPRTVQRELDRHKDGGNARRASRARKICALFAEVLEAEDMRLIRSSRGRSLTLTLLAPQLRQDDYPNLDLQDDDNRIVAEALSLRNDQRDIPVTFLSNDTPALVTAKHEDLAYQRLPPAWSLPKEADERDKTIENLRLQLAALQEQAPDLQFAIAGCTEGPLSWEMTVYPPLEASQRAAFLAYAKAARPMRESFSQDPPPQTKVNAVGFALRAALGGERWVPPSESAIRQYVQQDYPAWLAEVDGWLATIHDQLNRSVVGQIEVQLQNAGAAPAQSLLVTLESRGEIALLAPPQDRDSGELMGSVALPAPPSAPVGAWENPLSELGRALKVSSAVFVPERRLDSLLAPLSRDVNAFYWKPNRPTSESQRWELECSAFRHQHEPFTQIVRFRPQHYAVGSVSAVLRCRAHAANVPNVVEHLLPMRMTLVAGDTNAKVREQMMLCIGARQ
ncbi:conserved hypothetical protein [Cupriavidus taiwanensis]|uniref:PIN domain-containing protein n=1 Tax=Cupriavidus taiwanensis TaxID=164546 RepID=A0A975X560_9BURK|nr:PIN domain-containing protein [Cupriavidus taiwanensis]SOY58457.1 conserved hypothetical protein [Cupriavidus taiwanensis]